MSEKARELVERMAAAGEWPEPELFEQIAAEGEEAVEPLLEVVRRPAEGWPAEAPLYHAICLLAMIRSPKAVPDLVGLFLRYDNENLEPLPQALEGTGRAAVEPLLEVMRKEDLRWYPRAVASTAAAAASEGDPALRGRVLATLREVLADSLAHLDDLTSDQAELVSFVMGDLAEMADPKARDLVNAALEAGFTDIYDREYIEEVYRRGGLPPLKKTDQLKFLRESHEAHQRREREMAEAAARPRPAPPPALPPRAQETPSVAEPRRPSPFLRDERKVGRNDPCWCGSGKKYKKCHMRKDQK